MGQEMPIAIIPRGGDEGAGERLYPGKGVERSQDVHVILSCLKLPYCTYFPSALPKLIGEMIPVYLIFFRGIDSFKRLVSLALSDKKYPNKKHLGDFGTNSLKEEV